MLFADQPDRHDPAIAVGERGAKDRLEHEDALGVVPQRPVPEIADVGLALVEPVVEGLVIFRFTSPFPHARERMIIAV